MINLESRIYLKDPKSLELNYSTKAKEMRLMLEGREDFSIYILRKRDMLYRKLHGIRNKIAAFF